MSKIEQADYTWAMARDLSGRVIVITGASSGIGAATAVACAEQGMDVALAARRRDRLDQVAAAVTCRGVRALVVPCDVRRQADVRDLIDRSAAELGRLDAVFANAGHGLFGPVAEARLGQVRDLFETNFWGTVTCVQHAVPIMRRKGSGHILILSSALSEIGVPMYGFYAATKAAQDALASALRAELSGQPIFVSSVHPIGTATEFFDVVRRLSPPAAGVSFNTPALLVHSAEKVARAVVRCLLRPRPEVWPSTGARLGLAMLTALPPVSAWAMRRLMQRRYRAANLPVQAPTGHSTLKPHHAP